MQANLASLAAICDLRPQSRARQGADSIATGPSAPLYYDEARSGAQYNTLCFIARKLRLGVEIENRRFRNHVYKCCFIGGEAISYLTGRGFAATRIKARALGQEMLLRGLVTSVDGPPNEFCDSYRFYRFTCDADTEPYVGLRETSGVLADGSFKRWRFMPHTAHNSLVLDVSLAMELEDAMPSEDEPAKACALLKLRERVRQVCKPHAAGWLLKQERTTRRNGRVRTYERRKPVGDFSINKITGLISVAPRDFLVSFLDLGSRSQWEPWYRGGVVVETIDVPASLGGGEYPILPSPSSSAVATPSEQSTDSESLISRHSLGDDRRWLVPSESAMEDEQGAGRDRGCNERTSEHLPVGNFNEPALQEILRNLRQRIEDLDTRQCQICLRLTRPPREASNGVRLCACCGILSCAACCSQRVFDTFSRELVHVCDHCFTHSSRIKHAQHGGWHERGGLRKGQQSAGALAGEEALKDRECCGDYGIKWARCAFCGERVLRTIDAIDDHSFRCSARPRSGAQRQRVNSPPLPRASTSLTRIIYRTSQLRESRLFRKREACVLQDAFVDQDGAAHVYEVSVQHSSVENSPGHVPVEVLFLAYVARSLPDRDDISHLTAISQVDLRSGLPRWMVRLLAPVKRTGALDADMGEEHDGFDMDAVGGKRANAHRPSDLSWLSSTSERLRSRAATLGRLRHSQSAVSAPAKVPFRRASSGSIMRRSYASENEDLGMSLVPPVSARDFELMSVIGRGGFGKVYQVRHRAGGEIYAMKVLNKLDLRRRNQIERIQAERRVMSEVRHPFIVHLNFSFQTPHRVYLVMDFAQNGDLFTLLRRHGRLSEVGARLYIAEIGLALQHLHNRDIVYRDLKPENVLVAADGHIKLTDFGLCRAIEIQPALVLVSKEAGRLSFSTHSFCGTESYMPVEVLLNQGHNCAVDWWCLGLCAHEMMARKHPFEGATHVEVLRKICSQPPTLDPSLSPEARQLIQRLLRKNPDHRLVGLAKLQQEPFLQGLSFDDVLRKRLPPAIVPRLTGPEDVSAFSRYFTEEATHYHDALDAGVDADDSWPLGCWSGPLDLWARHDDPLELDYDGDHFAGFDYVDPLVTGGPTPNNYGQDMSEHTELRGRKESSSVGEECSV